NRLRQASRILEPEQRVDPFDSATRDHDPLEAALGRLTEPPGERPAEAVAELLRLLPGPDEHRLERCLGAATRLGEPFAAALLAPAEEALRAELPPPQEAALLQKSLFAADHFGRAAEVQNLTERFLRLLDSRRGADSQKLFRDTAGQCLRSLRKLGKRVEIDHLLRQTADWVLQGRDLAALKA